MSFHNINYYAGGTLPWGNDDDSDFEQPSCCDGKIEVLGFTTATLVRKMVKEEKVLMVLKAALQMGGKGERIAQCSEARVITRKAIPMQVGGRYEPLNFLIRYGLTE